MKNISTPSGFRDILTEEAAQREQIQQRVQALFAGHGFALIETPTLEVMDVMNASGLMPSSPFRFFDSRGDLLAMRPDVTLQVARMCATRLPASQTQARFRYTQRIFRDPDGRSDAAPRELKQMGVECIGECGVHVDAELIELFVNALFASGVSEVCLAMATVSPLRALLENSGASAGWVNAVLAACHASDFVELDKLCDLEACAASGEIDVEGIAPAYADVIRALPRIRGGREAIDAARALVAPLGCADGLDDFEATFDKVSALLKPKTSETTPSPNGVAQVQDHNEPAKTSETTPSLLVDFSVMSSFDYYTGVVFAAYSPYLGAAIGSGGRYDKLIGTFGRDRDAAGFAFSVEQAMAAQSAEALMQGKPRKLRIAVPKGALQQQAIECLEAAGLDIEGLQNIGRHLVISTDDIDYIIVRPSDAPAFVAHGAADCGICGRDSLIESREQVVQLVDLGFGACRFVVAQPEGMQDEIESRYRRLGSLRIATKYPNITTEHFAKTGVQVDIVKLNGNIELAPLTGMAERIVDITATGTTLRENNLEIVEEIFASTARFFANPSSYRTNDCVVQLADKLDAAASSLTFEAVAGKAM